jgi:hypothetical protein
MASRIDVVASEVSDLRAKVSDMNARLVHVENAVQAIPQIHADNVRQTYLLERGAEDRKLLMEDMKAVHAAMLPLKEFTGNAKQAKRMGIAMVLTFGGLISWTLGVWDKAGKLWAATGKGG